MRFGAIFGGNKSLYDDKIKETEEQKQKEMHEYEAHHKEGQTFEDWKAEKEAAAEKERKEKQKKAPVSGPLGKTSSSTVQLELDEEDKQILNEAKNRGYCYFRRDLTEDEKQMKETVHVPQKLDDATQAPTTDQSPSPQRGVSTWNNGATYEEKDTTNWCKSQIENLLEDFSCETDDDLSIETTDVRGLTGDAQIMVVRGTLRHFFDFSADVDFKVERDSKSVAVGTLKCDSISGAMDPAAGLMNYLQSAKIVWKTKEDSIDSDRVMKALKDGLNQRIARFHETYKQKC